MAMVMFGAAATAEDIVVGYTGPLSGPAAEYGQDCINGIDMAIRVINASGGVVVNGRRHTFRLEKMDDGIKPDVAIDNARKLRREHKVIAVFNPVANTIAAPPSRRRPGAPSCAAAAVAARQARSVTPDRAFMPDIRGV